VLNYRSRDDHHCKISVRKQRTTVGKFSFVNRTIADWNQLPEGVVGFSPVTVHIFSKRARNMITKEGKGSGVKLSEVKFWEAYI
jgi:hypothetical protein